MRTYFYLLGAVFLALFLKQWEPGLGNSSTAYGAEALKFSQDWQWFHIKMSEDFFNPYVDHPFLVIWLMGIVMKVFGASAHTVRLVSEISGLFIFSFLFFITRRFFGERAAVWSVILLLTVNPFTNFASSGWLDIPMLGFVWGGAFFILREIDRRQSFFYVALGSFLLGCAVLAKGVCALAIFPIFGFYAYDEYKQKRWYMPILAGLFVLLPVVAFTYLHYQSQGFVFWFRYLHREAVEQTERIPNILGYFWHFKDTFRFGHIVTLLGLWGMYDLWKRGKKEWSLFLLSGVLIHNIGYSWSSRHYAQYTLPVFPFLAIAAGYMLDQKLKKVNAERLARSTFTLMLIIFIVVDMLPIRVKSGNENPYRSFQSTLRIMNDNKNVYFVGNKEDQETWEDPAGYIVWFLGREPRMTSLEGLFKKIHSEDPNAIGIIDSKMFEMREDLRAIYPLAQRCMHNDKLTVIAQPSICDERVKTWRYRELPRAAWERVP